MAVIHLKSGEPVLVDDADLPLVSGYKWRLLKSHKGDNGGYAQTSVYISETKKRKTILMHKLICPGPGRLDHADGNKLNNQRFNLRPATRSQNAGNSKKRDGTSRFKGVCRRRNRWVAQLTTTVGGKLKVHFLGSFVDEEEAGAAYEHAAKEYFGQFARANLFTISLWFYRA